MISLPILFHPLKHHQHWICEYIRSWQIHSSGSVSDLKRQLLTIGASQMDFYQGVLTPEQIACEIVVRLQKEDKIQQPIYENWIKQQLVGYALVRLSDDSDWVLRIGEESGRFVHIHPARYATHTIRVKAGALKTAIAALIWEQAYSQDARSLTTINQVRQEWLDYSPIKSVELARGIERMIDLLTED